MATRRKDNETTNLTQNEVTMTNTDTNNGKQYYCSILLKEVREKMRKLKEFGMSEKEITSLLYSDRPLHKLTVSRNYRICFGEKRVEVQMEPLVRSVYLLFLRHPEGIVFKNLPDYRHELIKIYSEVRPWGLTDRALQSIEDVTNPLLNSINEKCARIRRAFLSVLDDSVATHYYIDGRRGEAKIISLPRDLVVWE